jgi:hypothetical protein
MIAEAGCRRLGLLLQNRNGCAAVNVAVQHQVYRGARPEAVVRVPLCRGRSALDGSLLLPITPSGDAVAATT